MKSTIVKQPRADHPKVSVLVPIFNVEKYLKECLDSIVNQTLPELEVICINDGSTDNSGDIIDTYAAKDPRIVVIHKENSGYGDSMNKGLELATGEYVGIVESDDFAEPNMFEELYNLAKKYTADVAKSNFYSYYTHLDKKSPMWNKDANVVYNKASGVVIRAHNTKNHIIPAGSAKQLIDPRVDQRIFHQSPAIWAGIYNREFLNKNGIGFLPSGGASYQDTGFNFKVWACARRAVFTDEAYLHYRRDNDASSVHNPGKVFCVADEYSEIEKFLKKKNLYPQLASVMQKTKFSAYMWNYRRLTTGLDADFLKHFTKEVKKSLKDKSLNTSYFNKRELRDLNEITQNPDLFQARKSSHEQARLSIVLPVQGEDSVAMSHCIDSLLSQSLKDIEIICITNDIPSDLNSDLEKYRNKDPRVTVSYSSSERLADKYNHGMSLVHTEYMVLCDSKISYPKTYCKNLYTTTLRHQVDLVSCVAEGKYTGKVTRINNSTLKNLYPTLYGAIFKTVIQKANNIRFPLDINHGYIKFIYDFATISKTIYLAKSSSKQIEYYPDTPMDYIRNIMASVEFMKAHNIFDTRKDFFIYNFKKYYTVTKDLLPATRHNHLDIVVSAYLRKNKSYFNSVSTDIVDALSDLVPKNIFAIRVKQRIKNTVTRSR